MANFSVPHDDDNVHDHIGSNGSTPSGMATPQPDPVDKRLPSIMHYFTQVGNSSGFCQFLSRKAPLSTPSCPPSEGSAQADLDFERYSDDGHGGHELAPNDTVEQAETKTTSPSDTSSIEEPKPEKRPTTLHPNTLPTPPYSKASSPSHSGAGGAEADVPSAADKPVTSLCPALAHYHIQSSSDASESLSRRPTSLPISSVSDDPVLASHFSNPSMPDSSELPSLPAVPLLAHEKIPHSKSSENLAKLTGNAADGSRLKNTPPLTPRAMSNENPPSERSLDSSMPPPSNNRTNNSTNNTSEELTGRLNAAFPAPASSSQEGPTVASLKGKLAVRISEARGLRPSLDPYVVCVFEWNEYISKGVQSGGRSPQNQKDGSENDTGRPMAIPMRSRQSSHNSQLDAHDPKNKMLVTDPQWNHEAVL